MVHQPHNANTEQETKDVMQITNAIVRQQGDAEHHNIKDCAENSTRVKPENVLQSRQTTAINRKSLMKVAIYLLVLGSIGVILYVVWHFAISTHSK